MTIVYPRIECRAVKIVINRMQWLIARRKYGEISRAQFLEKYSELRNELNLSPEYVALRRLIVGRSRGVCEKCGVKRGSQMAHKQMVARRPDLALHASNVYWGCVECHQLDHPEIKLGE